MEGLVGTLKDLVRSVRGGSSLSSHRSRRDQEMIELKIQERKEETALREKELEIREREAALNEKLKTVDAVLRLHEAGYNPADFGFSDIPPPLEKRGCSSNRR